MTLQGALALLLHAPLMAGAALLLAGLLPWAEARWHGRLGPPVLLPWHEGRRLLRKQPVAAEGHSALLPAAPGAALVLTAAAALLVPSFALGMVTAPMADLVVIVGLLAAARAVLALAAIDGATAVGGLAALASLRLASLAMPALVLVVLSVALLAGTTNLDAAVAALREAPLPGLPLLLASAALACVLVAVEAEPAGTLDGFAGWHLLAGQAAMALRRVVWLSLLAALLLPRGLAPADAGVLDWIVGVLTYAAKLAVLAAAGHSAARVVRRRGPVGLGPVMGAAALLGVLALLFLFAAPGLA